MNPSATCVGVNRTKLVKDIKTLYIKLNQIKKERLVVLARLNGIKNRTEMRKMRKEFLIDKIINDAEDDHYFLRVALTEWDAVFKETWKRFPRYNTGNTVINNKDYWNTKK